MSPILFVITLLLGLLFISAAVVVWLAEWLGCLTLSLSVVGICYLLVALLLYLRSLRPMLQSWRARLNTVYEVSVTFEVIYGRVVALIKKVVDGFK